MTRVGPSGTGLEPWCPPQMSQEVARFFDDPAYFCPRGFPDCWCRVHGSNMHFTLWERFVRWLLNAKP